MKGHKLGKKKPDKSCIKKYRWQAVLSPVCFVETTSVCWWKLPFESRQEPTVKQDFVNLHIEESVHIKIWDVYFLFAHLLSLLPTASDNYLSLEYLWVRYDYLPLDDSSLDYGTNFEVLWTTDKKEKKNRFHTVALFFVLSMLPWKDKHFHAES